MSDTWAQLATLAVALVCFEVGERLHGSGFVAAFAGGLAFALRGRARRCRTADMQVSEAAGQLLELMVFAMFGGYAVIVGWRDAGWRVVVFAVVALFGVRLVAVSVALLRSDLPGREPGVHRMVRTARHRHAGAGPAGRRRGEIEQEPLITQVVVVTVTLSLVVHSLTAWPGIRCRFSGGASRDPGAKPSVITRRCLNRQPAVARRPRSARRRRDRCPSGRAPACR